MTTHYDILGVRSDAPVEEIRSAYRTRARESHPDAQASDSTRSSGDMAALNEAWRVLSDPGRRALYDASLRNPSSAHGSAAPQSSRPRERFPVERPEPSPGAGSGRFPKWPFVLVFLLAVIFILTAGALRKPAKPEAPDGWLVVGSCVVVEGNGDAAEVGCETDHDATVVTVVGFDAACPTDTETHRDRQGRGYACVVRTP